MCLSELDLECYSSKFEDISEKYFQRYKYFNLKAHFCANDYWRISDSSPKISVTL